MDWRTLQYPAFQVLWSSLSQDDRPAPLQIRSFTSDSYRAIKERERKKRCQQNNAISKQWSNTQNKDVLSESASEETVLEMPPMDCGPNDGISTSESVVLQRATPINQHDYRTKPDHDLQHKFGSLGAAPISPLEDAAQCLSLPTTPAMSPNAPSSSRSEVFAGTEQSCKTLRERDPHQSATSVDELHVIIPDDDAGTSVQQPENGILYGKELAVATPSYPTHAYSDAAGCNSNSSEHILAVTRRPPSRHTSDQLALAEILPDAQSHVVSIGRNVGSATCRAGPGRAGRTNWKCKSMTQSPWTSERDQHLLHLRDVAQLNWETIVNYFPEATPNAVKRHYKQLNERKINRQTVGKQRTWRARGRGTATFPATSACGKAAAKVGKNHQIQPIAVSRRPATSTAPEHDNTRRRRNVTTRLDNGRDVAFLASPTHGDARQRTSRSGRPILHPFRHRPSEGYLYEDA